MLDTNKMHCGDCMDVMKDIDSDSVDCIVTDPPYGLSFMDKDWDKAVPSIAIWQECLRVLKPGAFAFVMCIPRQDCLARMICRLEDAEFNVAFSSIYWAYASGFPKAQNLSKAVDKRVGVKREVIAIDKVAAAKGNKTKFNQCTAITPGNVGVNTREFSAHTGEITKAVTDQAKVLDGAYGGFQPKPAVEIIIVAMKPLSERTYMDQAISNGHGCTWLDDCRIPYETEKDATFQDRPNCSNKRYSTTCFQEGISIRVHNRKGRFPANVLCEDDVLDDGIERKSGAVLTHYKRSGNSNLGKTFKIRDRTGEFADRKSNSGEYSRYFSLDAWFSERIKSLPKEAQKTFPWLIVPKVSKSEKNQGCEDISNGHPTCKPIRLMSWLITLASREGDIVLDPFCGSGTTLIAAKMLGRQYIGVDREEDYCEIARKRVSVIPMRLVDY